MKQIDFIISENVVNIQSPEKFNIIGEHSYGNNDSVLLAAIDKKNRFNSEKIRIYSILVFLAKILKLLFPVNQIHILTNSTKNQLFHKLCQMKFQ